MSSDLDRVFKELAKVLEGLTFSTSGRSNPGPEGRTRGGISVDVSLKVSSVEEFLASARGFRDEAETTPLIDIIEDEKRVKVLVLLPGIRRDDVSVLVSGETLRVEVAKGEELYVREIVCTSPPENASIISARENNSVVELVFAKEGRPRR